MVFWVNTFMKRMYRTSSPSQVSSELRRIASSLEKSRNPSREAVSRALKRVIASVGDSELLKVNIDDGKNFISVRYKGNVHAAKFVENLDELQDGKPDLVNVVGEPWIIRAALMAWSGPSQFELTPQELVEAASGYQSFVEEALERA